MENPFIYGEVVPRAAFVNREDELDRLCADLSAGQKVFLISPRRYGKSSLIHQGLLRLQRQGAIAVNVTVSSFSSYLGFLEGYAGAIAVAEASFEDARSWLMRALTGTQPQVHRESPTRPGSMSVTFPGVGSSRHIRTLAAEVFELPARLAAAMRRPVVVALDEFQAIQNFDGSSVEHTLRAAVQHQRRVGYVFAGSEPSLMEAMLGPRRPFYKAGPVLRLDRIPPEVFASFIESRFRRTRCKPSSGLGAAIVDLAGNLPYDVQRLAHEVWDDVQRLGKRSVSSEDLHHTLKRLLVEQHTVFEAAWQRLTLPQRAVLRAVVFEDGKELLSADVRARYRLGGASTVQTALAALQRDELITRDGTRYEVIDSLLREWVVRSTY